MLFIWIDLKKSLAIQLNLSIKDKVIGNTVKPVYKGQSLAIVKPVYKGQSLVIQLNLSIKDKVIGNTVKPVYKGHRRRPENSPFMSSWLLYTGSDYVHYSLYGRI